MHYSHHSLTQCIAAPWSELPRCIEGVPIHLVSLVSSNFINSPISPARSLPRSLRDIVSSDDDNVYPTTAASPHAAESLPLPVIGPILEHPTESPSVEPLARKSQAATRPTASYFSAAVSAVKSLFFASRAKSTPSAQAVGIDAVSLRNSPRECIAADVVDASSPASRQSLIDRIMSPASGNFSVDPGPVHIDLGPESQSALAATRSLARSTRWLLPPRWPTSLCWAENAAWLGEASVKRSAHAASLSYRLCLGATVAHSTICVASSVSNLESLVASDAELLRIFLGRSSFSPGDMIRGHLDMRESEFHLFSASISLESVETIQLSGTGPSRVKTKTWACVDVYSLHSRLFPFQFALPDGDTSAAAFASDLIKLSWRLRFSFSAGPRSHNDSSTIGTPEWTNQCRALEWVLAIPIRHDKTRLDGIQEAGHRAMARGVGPF